MKYLKKDRSRYSFAFLFSVCLHVLLCAYIYKSARTDLTQSHLSQKQAGERAHNIKLDSVKFITHEQLQAIKENKNKQIVANELNGMKERPKESRFAGEADQTFDRQTMASANGAFKKAGLGNKNGQQTQQTDQTREDSPAPQKLSKVKKAKSLKWSDFGAVQMAKSIDDEMIQVAALEEVKRKMREESQRANALGVEQGSAGTSGLASNNDFVEDVPLGDMTNLNTTEFKYYGFYHRIRQKLEQYWGSTIQSKAKNLYKTGRRLPGSENLITAITVTLDEKGNILEIKIDGTSGIRELDQAAIESFNKAGPFPNPPKGLLVGGRAIIQWGFVVKS